MDKVDCPEVGTTALFPLPSRDLLRSVDPELKARLTRAAAALDHPSPHVIPGAAALLLCLDLPLQSDRKRRIAARFAAEPYLATSLDHTHVAVGPVVRGTARLCAAINKANEELQTETAGAIVPDLCAVPLPQMAEAWSIWCGADTIYVRTSDGNGCVISSDTFPEIWCTARRPKLEVWYGKPPTGVHITKYHQTIPKVDPSIFELDLRLSGPSTHGWWRPHLGFTAVVSALAGIAHLAVLFADAQALDRAATDRHAALADHLSARGLPLDINLPAQASAARLIQSAQKDGTSDLFLRLMSRTGDALAGSQDIAFRDLRYDASTGTLTVLMRAPDLAALQRTENALRAGGMKVTSGAAATGASGAEMQLTLSEAT
ncbi:MAG: type II secretion system protein GspL [Pseudomonadota bacterium]